MIRRCSRDDKKRGNCRAPPGNQAAPVFRHARDRCAVGSTRGGVVKPVRDTASQNLFDSAGRGYNQRFSPSSAMIFAVALTGLFITSFLLTGAVRGWSASGGLPLDVPIARSSHDQAMPTAGGIAIALLFLAYAGAYRLEGSLPLRDFIALAGTAWVALLGLCDDIWKLSLSARLTAQFAAAAWALLWLGVPPPIDGALFVIDNPWLLGALAVPALVWLVNLYNFMDGIDGLAASQLVFVGVMAYLIALAADDAVLGQLGAGLAAAALGFLVWNWPPARIFMGDVGSNFSGFALGVLALLSLSENSTTVWTWLLLLGVFVVDTGVTLFRRVGGGEKWFEGHRSHAYQHAASRYGGHRRVTLAVLAINCCWLAPLAWWSAIRPEWGMPLALLGLTPLIALALWLDAGIAPGDEKGV